MRSCLFWFHYWFLLLAGPSGVPHPSIRTPGLSAYLRRHNLTRGPGSHPSATLRQSSPGRSRRTKMCPRK
uniref:Putative secreted protein n=1 Tax=Ixodes ricinus TaxID=34613 RepID=A0A6B0TTS3_IXORI